MGATTFDKDELKSPDQVRALHADIMNVFRDHITLSDSAGIYNKSSLRADDWIRATDADVAFYLIDPTCMEVAWRERGGDVNVLPIKGTQNLWVSWYEKWHVHSKGKFVMLAVSLTLWSGAALSKGKEQLIRAEWDHHSTAAINSGQPHWQIDHPVGINYGIEIPPTTPGGLEAVGVPRLEEVPDESINWQVISGYHLGMRGDWTSSDMRKRGWKSQWQNDGKELHQWLRLCLAYLVDQAISYPAKPF